MRPSTNTDKKLLKAAIELFPKTGCSGLSLHAVAKRAKVNLGMFYYHFKNKDEFLMYVLQEIYDAFFNKLEVESHSHEDPVENLKGVILGFADFFTENKEILSPLFKDLVGGDPVVEKFVQKNFHKHIFLITGLIIKAQKTGQITSEVSPIEILIMLLTSVNVPLFLYDAMTTKMKIVFNISHMGHDSVSSRKSINKRLNIVLKGLANE